MRLPVAAMAVDVDSAARLYEELGKANDLSAVITINITKDIVFNGEQVPTNITAKSLVVNGNGHTLSNLTMPLFNHTNNGGVIHVSNLTIANSNIAPVSGDASDDCAGAFIGNAFAKDVITLKNCHVRDSKISGKERVGGLIGWAGGFTGQGAVYETVNIIGGSVTNCEIKGAAAGGVIGHSGYDQSTTVNIANITVAHNQIISTDTRTPGDYKAGSIAGTDGTGKTSISANEYDNDVTCGGVPITSPVGRTAHGNTGETVITGGSYEGGANWYNEQGQKRDIGVEKGRFVGGAPEELLSDGSAAPIAKDNDNVYYVGEDVIRDALDNTVPGDTFEMLQSQITYYGETFKAGDVIEFLLPPAPSANVPKTGDHTPIALCGILMALAAAGMAILAKKRKAEA